MAFRSVCYNETSFSLFHSSDSASDLPEVRWHDDVQVGCKCTSLIKSYYIVVHGFTSVS